MARMKKTDAHGFGGPRPKSIVAEENPRGGGMAAAALAAVTPAPGIAKYQILITDQIDPYDKPLPRAALATFSAVAGDNYTGTDRKAAKLSISNAEVESFDDLKDLIQSLTPDKKMINHKPKITRDAKQNRVQEEQRNVRVRAFLYAASRENDNDFHLILGRDPNESPRYMTMELSALPPKSARSYETLKSARDAFKEFFGSKLPGPTYHFYRPPIPVEIGGSLFFDITHAKGPHPGPADLRPNIPTIWEVHPVTEINFEP